MRKIEVNDLQDNFVNILANEWMLVTAGTKDKFNTMTASWGGIGYVWNKPVVFTFVRPERYTYEFTEANELFTLSFLGLENKEMHKICGSKSGRTVDKVKETGLIPFETENDAIAFQQSRLAFECRKLYTDIIKEENFIDKGSFPTWYSEAKGNPHKMYVAEILNVWVQIRICL